MTVARQDSRKKKVIPITRITASDQVEQHVIDRGFDEARDVAGYDQTHALWCVLLELSDFGHDGLGHLDRVAPGLAPHFERNTDDAVELCVASFVGHGILDPGNIVEPGAAPAFAMGEHHLLELFGGAGLGKRAHTEFALSRFGFQPPAGQLGVFVPDRPEDIGRAQANRLQLRWIEPDSHFPVATANQGDRADSGDALQPFLDHFIGKARQFRDGLLAGNHHRNDRCRVRIEPFNYGRIRIVRQVGDNSGNLVAHLLRLHIGIFIELKLNVDLRQPVRADRPELADPRNRIDRLLDLVCHFGFDARGGSARLRGLH
jgi:hypothetical protein